MCYRGLSCHHSCSLYSLTTWWQKQLRTMILVWSPSHPRQSRRHPAKILNDLDFADDIALLESSIPSAQLTRTAWPHHQCSQDRVYGYQLQSSMKKGSCMDCFLEVGKDLEKSINLHLHQNQAFQHHLCDSASLWMWTLGYIRRHKKQDQCICYILLQDHAEHQATWLCEERKDLDEHLTPY